MGLNRNSENRFEPTSKGCTCQMTGNNMSPDMSTANQEVVISDRKQQILEEAIRIIASEGYAKLTMRALARASGMKLGALQYHFLIWEDMLRALATYIAETYRHWFEAAKSETEALSLRDIVEFIVDNSPGSASQADRTDFNCQLGFRSSCLSRCAYRCRLARRRGTNSVTVSFIYDRHALATSGDGIECH